MRVNGGATKSQRIDNTRNIQNFTLFNRSSFLMGLFLGNDYLQPFLTQTSVYSDTGRETKSVWSRGKLFSKSTDNRTDLYRDSR